MFVKELKYKIIDPSSKNWDDRVHRYYDESRHKDDA